MKACSNCFKSKPLDEFYKDSRSYSGRYSICKDCYTNKSFIRMYGITKQQYDELYKNQNGLCAICNQVPSGKGSHARLHVDHNHKTNEVRGLLCGKCNWAIGYFNDNPELLEKAIKYLGAQSTETRRTLKSVS